MLSQADVSRNIRLAMVARAALKKDAGGRLHISAGNAGGGQFANLHTRVVPLLQEWLSSGADPADSPLNGWSTTQLRKLAQQRGMSQVFPPRTKALVMHSAILADVKQRGANPVGAVTARKAPVKAAPTSPRAGTPDGSGGKSVAAQSGDPALTSTAAVAAAPKKAPAKNARQSLPDGPIAHDIPEDVAYKRGRRIYVKTSYQSKLNDDLRAIGAKWDPDEKALFVGTGKLDQVVPLVQARQAYRQQTADVKAGGRWVSIPFPALAVRQQAKDLGARWDAERKQWAFPTDESRDTIQRLVDDWAHKRDRAKAKQREDAQARADADRKAQADQARMTKAERDQRTIDQSGRTVVGSPATATTRSGRRMRRAEADQAKPKPGRVINLGGGRRGLVLGSDATFVSEDMAEDGLIGNPGDGAGWYFTTRYVPVEATPDEVAQDRRADMERQDAADVRRIMLDASQLGDMQHDVPLRQIKGKKILEYGVGSDMRSYGQITLTPDGEVWYQHPGFYDSYISTQGRITDPDAIARINGLFAAGSRSLTSTRGGIQQRYEIRA